MCQHHKHIGGSNFSDSERVQEKVSSSPPASTNYLSHHLAGIVTAAVFADAAHIVEEIVLLKTRVTAAAAALTLPSERVAYSPVLPNPAGFEPRIPPVCNSGPVCRLI
jgi:hypothetical protein